MKSGSYSVLPADAARCGRCGAPGGRPSPRSAATESKLGEAFALRDDLLGVWGDPAQTGKPAGDDLLSGKPTVILSLGDRALRGASKRILSRVGTRDLSPADVTSLQDALRASGVQQAVESRISDHVEAAVAALDHPALDRDGVTGLTQMAHRIAWRDR